MTIVLLTLAVILGSMFQWPLVQASLQGNLTVLLDQKRQERREVQFQGIKTLDLARAHQLWEEGQALFVDARKADEYQELHVQGAVNVPPETWEFTDPLRSTWCGVGRCQKTTAAVPQRHVYRWQRRGMPRGLAVDFDGVEGEKTAPAI